jgi:hypothetical protein
MDVSSAPAVRPILIAVAFLSITLAGDRLAGLVLENLTDRSLHRFSRLYAGHEDARLVIVGNSRAARDFPPTRLRDAAGGNVSNIGFPGMSMSIAGASLLDYLDHNRHPEVVMIETTNIGGAGQHGLLKDFGPFAGQSRRLRALMERYIPRKALFFKLSHLFRYNGDMLPRIMFSLNEPDLDMPSRGHVTPQMREILRIRTLPPMAVAKENAQALLEMIRACRTNGIEVVLVVAPYLPLHLSRIPNYPEWRDEVQELAGEDVPLLDYAAALESESYFRDGVHLNESGVGALMPMLDRDLSQYF